MSLLGSGRGEYGPECVDLILQVGQASAVVQNHIGRHPAVFPTGLGADPRLPLGAGEAVTSHHSPDLGFMINIDSDYKIEFLLLVSLDQQGNDVDNDCRSTRCSLQLRGSGPDSRMHNPLEISPRLRISENDFSKACPVEPAADKHLRAESLDDRGERWSARFDDLAGQ
jgi:hypothetical protein